MPQYDYLIIGQGLAGSILAWELLQRECKVLVLDNHQESASQVAAGLINPITGMRLVKSVDVDVLLPAAKQLYQQLGQVFQQRFFVEMPMLRIFKNSDECKQAQKRLQNPGYQDYLGELRLSHELLHAPLGYIKQQQTGYLLTRPLLNSLKLAFMARDCYRQTQFSVDELTIHTECQWQHQPFKKIIFCEGHQASANPWFSWLPFQLAKGEILTLTQRNPLPTEIINHGHWLIPLANHEFRIGSTFDRNALNTEITTTGKAALLNGLKQLSPHFAQAQVIDQQANIRPCTLDKAPFLGPHPQHPDLLIFNGFGAKGSLQIPWYAQRFADYLLKHTPIPKTCSIERYYETHFPH